jgi:hypothetical protein
LIWLSERITSVKATIYIIWIFWIVIIGVATTKSLDSIYSDLLNKRNHNMLQEKNVRAYLCSNENFYLINNDIPYPDWRRLKSLLDNEKLRKILPGNIYYENTTLTISANGSPFCNPGNLKSSFSINDFDLNNDSRLVNKMKILNNKWNGTDYEKSKINGIVIIGSFIDSETNLGEISIEMKKGQSILFKSGPSISGQKILINSGSLPYLSYLPQSNNWVELIFDNISLPEKFEVTLIDTGTEWGEWSAIGLKESK